jgi:hypothetical protein
MIGQTVTMTTQTYDMKSTIDTPNDGILNVSQFPECRASALYIEITKEGIAGVSALDLISVKGDPHQARVIFCP